MMDQALLDTDILSEVLKAKNPTVVERAATYKIEVGPLALSVVTVMEIVSGFQRQNRSDALQKFLDGLKESEVLAFDLASAEIAGRIHADLLRAGQPIGRADPMIAATALRHQRILVTGNLDHYRRIQALGYSLRLDNWR